MLRSVPPPVVVFGTGGSGTRAVSRLLADAELHMGPQLNRAGDALCLKPFLRRWPEHYVERSAWIEHFGGRGGAADLSLPRAMKRELEQALECQREGIAAADARWGWKAPRSIFVLPAIAELLPGVRTVQLVRDGRDMAYSANQNQLEALGPVLLGDLAGEPVAVRSIALWARVNLAARSFAREHLGDRHLVARYEDLCTDPIETVGRILDHAGIESTPELRSHGASLVEPSSSSGRWRAAPAEEQEALTAAGVDALREFGYASAARAL